MDFPYIRSVFSSVVFEPLRIAAFRRYFAYRFLLTLGIQMMETVLGWQLYDYTGDEWVLGLIGLWEALPFIITSFGGGYVADHFNRKRIVLLATVGWLVCCILLFALTGNNLYGLKKYGVWPVYVLIGLTGVVRGFMAPALTAMFSQVLPRRLYGQGVTLNTNAWQIGAVLGPAAGGVLYGWGGGALAYSAVLLCIGLAFVSFLLMQVEELPAVEQRESFFTSLKEGLHFLRSQHILLSSISLDLFAVLLGGAVALLPAFARDVLHCGPEGLGLLRGATFMGSAVMGLFLLWRPPFARAGRNLLISVSLFGLCIVGFGLSRSFALSFVMLFLSGMFDNVSVIIRSTILQTMTPDHMRGRVAAINSVFISSSNEIGAFESGAMAKLLGLIPSVVVGGLLTQAVVMLTAWRVPGLRKLRM